MYVNDWDLNSLSGWLAQAILVAADLIHNLQQSSVGLLFLRFNMASIINSKAGTPFLYPTPFDRQKPHWAGAGLNIPGGKG